MLKKTIFLLLIVAPLYAWATFFRPKSADNHRPVETTPPTLTAPDNPAPLPAVQGLQERCPNEAILGAYREMELLSDAIGKH